MSGIDIISYKLGQKSAGGGSGGGSVRLQNKTFNANGTYKADAGYDGLGTVTVDVAGSGGSDEDWIIGDGNTHLWISLPEGRTSPMLGVGVSGTVTVDWGDGSTPDVLTDVGIGSVNWTPNHNYAAAGDYVITLSGGNQLGFVGTTSGAYLLAASSKSSDNISRMYRNALKKIELGANVTIIDNYAFCSCNNLTDIVIPKSIIKLGSNAFQYCYALTNVIIPDGVTNIGKSTFSSCYALTNVVIPKSIIKLGSNAFQSCYALTNVIIPDGVTNIGTYAFSACYALTNVIIPKSVKNIAEGVFQNCYALAYVDFSAHTTVPTLSATNAFSGIPADCEIRVPAALVDEWKAATNWSTYADKIVGV